MTPLAELVFSGERGSFPNTYLPYWVKKKKKYVFYILPMLQNRLRKVLKCNSIYIWETYIGSRWRQWNKEKQGHTHKMKPSMSLGHDLLSAGLPEAPRASPVSPVLSACMVFWCWFHHADPTPSHWLTAPCSQTSISALAVFLQLWHAQESPGELVKNADCWAPLPEFFIQQVWSGAWEGAFPTSFQVMLKLWVWGAQFETQSSDGFQYNRHPLDQDNVFPLTCMQFWLLPSSLGLFSKILSWASKLLLQCPSPSFLSKPSFLLPHMQFPLTTNLVSQPLPTPISNALFV